MEYESNNGIERGEPEVDEARRALVTKLVSEVQEDEKHWGPSFKRMREDMKFVRRQLPSETDDDERAKANIVQRHIKQRVASLYAKNPTFVAKRRPRLDFAIWDGKQSSLMAAAQEMTAAQGAPAADGMPARPPMAPSPETVSLLADIQQGLQKRQMLDRVGKTLEILLKHSLAEQQPGFKPQCKQLVRRSVICTVGYVKIMFQRQLEKRPDIESRLDDVTRQLATFERLQADAADGELEPNTAEIDELRNVQAALQGQVETIVREGLVYDFPSSLRVIPDRETVLLAQGFPGARRVSEKFLLSCEQIKETYGVDIKGSYTGYKQAGDRVIKNAKEDAKAVVYEIYDRADGLLYVVCEGYPDFLKAPEAPPLAYMEGFFPFLPLVFNVLEEEGEIFPESDVRLLRPTQREVNRKVEAIRQHRIASRPLYVGRKGVIGGEEEAKSLANHAAHDMIELEGLAEGQKIGDVFQQFEKVGVDPNLYETGTDVSLMQLIVGAQEANLGGTSGDSATESSIAENSRLTTIASEIDELDDFLSTLARLSGQVLLNEMSEDTVKAVVGIGAVWPQLRRQEIAEEIYLEIEAGSSGRPNTERDLANLERAAPTILQLPGINPEWFAGKVVKTLGADIDLEEAITAGLPSITTLNRQSQVGTGDPATDPNQQGGEGGDNAPNDDSSTGGPQAAQPAASVDQQNALA